MRLITSFLPKFGVRMFSLIAALKKVISRNSTNDVLLSTLRELVSFNVVGYYGEGKKNDETYYNYFTRELNERKVEDEKDEEDEENIAAKERKIAPEEMQEQLKKVVLKSRSPIEREHAITRLDDNFLVEQIKNPKQMMRIRLYALDYAPTEVIDDIAKTCEEEEIRKKAIEKCHNKDIILKYIKDTGYYQQLWKLDPKTILDNFPENFKFDMLEGRNWRSRSQDYFRVFVNKLKNPKDIIFVLEKCFADDKWKTTYFFEHTLFECLNKIKDKKIFKEWITTKEFDKDNQAYIVMYLKDDKKTIKELLDTPYLKDDIRKLILEILDDQKLYKDTVIENILAGKTGKRKAYDDDDDIQPDQITHKGKKLLDFSYDQLVPFCLNNIKDEKFIKNTINKFNLIVPTVVKKIKDNDFLKEYFKTTLDANALINITDNDLLIKLAKKDPHYLKYVKDESFLKEAYQNLAENPHPESSHFDRDQEAKIRANSLNNIKDQDFLIKVAKKDSSFIVRKAAIKNITDIETVEKFLLRETSKTGKMEILEIIDNQDILMSFIKKQKDPEIARQAYDKLDVDSITKLVSEGLDVPESIVQKMDSKVLKKLISEEQAIAGRYISLVTDDQDFLVRILKKYPNLAVDVANDIDSENVITELLTDGKFLNKFSSYEKITDPKYLEYILLNKEYMYYKDVSDILIQLNPSQDFLIKIIENASENVAEETVKYITDIDFLVSIVAKEKESSRSLPFYIFKKIWTQVKGNEEQIKKMANTKNIDVIEKLLPHLAKQDNQLIKIVKNLKDRGWQAENLVVKAISLLEDKKQIMGMIPHLTSRQLAQIDPGILYEWLLTTKDQKDIEFNTVHSVLASIFSSGDIDPLALYNTAKSDIVKSVAILQIKPEDFPENITDNMINSFISGMQQTDRPYEISKTIVKRIYDVASDVQQDQVASYLDTKDLNERHRDALERPYLIPKKKEKIYTPLKHDVEKVPITQLFRLLVHLAR